MFPLLAPAPSDRPYGWFGSYLIRAAFVAFAGQLGGTAVGLVPLVGKWISNPAMELVTTRIISGKNGIMLAEMGVGIVGGLVWMIFARRRTHTRELFHLAHLLARGVVAGTLLQYAVWKVFPTWTGPPAQLWHPLPSDLISPLGDMGPGGMFWQWPGVAPTYVMFTAVVEIVGAIMLFFDRTVILGTFLSFASLMNIAMMIQGYFGLGAAFFWTPGRRFPAVAFILYAEWPRIRGFLFCDEAIVPARPREVWRPEWMRYISVGLRIAIVFRIFQAQEWIRYAEHSFGRRPRLAVEGVYAVDRFALNGATPSERDADKRWSWFGVYACTGVAIAPDGTRVELRMVPDSSTTDNACNQPDNQDSWPLTGIMLGTDTARFVRKNDRELEVRGILKGDTIVALVRKLPDEEMPLWNPRWFWNKPR